MLLTVNITCMKEDRFIKYNEEELAAAVWLKTANIKNWNDNYQKGISDEKRRKVLPLM